MRVGFYGYLGLVVVGFVPAVLVTIQACMPASQMLLLNACLFYSACFMHLFSLLHDTRQQQKSGSIMCS